MQQPAYLNVEMDPALSMHILNSGGQIVTTNDVAQAPIIVTLPVPPIRTYPSFDIAFTQINEFAQAHGFHVVRGSAPRTWKRILPCDHGPRAKRGVDDSQRSRRARTSKKTDCPFRLNVLADDKENPATSSWTVRYPLEASRLQHNHSPDPTYALLPTPTSFPTAMPPSVLSSPMNIHPPANMLTNHSPAHVPHMSAPSHMVPLGSLQNSYSTLDTNTAQALVTSHTPSQPPHTSLHSPQPTTPSQDPDLPPIQTYESVDEAMHIINRYTKTRGYYVTRGSAPRPWKRMLPCGCAGKSRAVDPASAKRVRKTCTDKNECPFRVSLHANDKTDIARSSWTLRYPEDAARRQHNHELQPEANSLVAYQRRMTRIELDIENEVRMAMHATINMKQLLAQLDQRHPGHGQTRKDLLNLKQRIATEEGVPHASAMESS